MVSTLLFFVSIQSLLQKDDQYYLFISSCVIVRNKGHKSNLINQMSFTIVLA